MRRVKVVEMMMVTTIVILLSHCTMTYYTFKYITSSPSLHLDPNQLLDLNILTLLSKVTTNQVTLRV